MKTFLLLLAFTLLNGATTLSVATYKRLAGVEKLIQEKRLDEAGEALRQMLARLPRAAIDRAYTFRSAGMYYLQRENYEEATRLLLQAYHERALPEAQTLRLAELIGNLYLHGERYAEAAVFYERCLAAESGAEKRIVIACAVAYYRLERFSDVAALLEKERGRFVPDEALYRMLFASYYALKQYSAALKTVDEMLRHWSGKREYWLQQSALYYETGQRAKALASIELAYRRGVLEKEDDYMRYVYMLVEMQIPYKAGEVLARFIEEKKVSDSERHRELLAQCRSYAREKPSDTPSALSRR